MGAGVQERVFPAGFVWGAATSSHQVEGGNHENDWWDWEAQPGRIRDGSRSGEACGWWGGRAETDLAAAAAHGHTAHRLGLEWSRLEPEEGRFSGVAFDRYAAVLDTMRELGLDAMVTLSHFTLPRWAARRGSWLDGSLPRLFGRFATECARRLGGRVRWWATLNEPQVLAFMGYAGTRWPPGLGSLPAALRALRGMARAHRAAYRAVHRVIEGAAVGVVMNLPRFSPASGGLADRAAARAQDLVFGSMPLAAFRPVDWVGLNYYGRYEVRFDPRAAGTLFGRHVQSPTVSSGDNDWGQIAPDGLEEQLVRLRGVRVPLFVTENGVWDDEDRVRPRYLVEHVAAVHRAIERGADVRGYFHWSLVDNFEWAEGWAVRFGLIAIDPATQERRPRRSMEVYQRICEAHGVPPDLEPS
jgi:beta-glucosidase